MTVTPLPQAALMTVTPLPQAALLDDLDAEFGVGDLVAADSSQARAAAYTAGDLRGLTVQHEADRFVEGRDVVLTIQDRGVLEEDEGDVLVNVNMVDDERHEKVGADAAGSALL